jgi:tetratricopeptide (TPR) repeat protein
MDPMISAGPYRLETELGSGGMGTVYRSGDVAVKVIHPHLVGKGDFRARFEREVEIGRRVRHENVVATLGAGETELDGKPTLYLAMELVEGQTLRDLLDELGTVPEELCLHIAAEVARALDAIHKAGAFHRDVKPENVLITRENRIKVMDMGVALLADESLRLSQSGVFVGSVLYAAPEQFSDQHPDGRADLYMLGLLLYELATGSHPFMADDMGAVIQKQLNEQPRRPAELNPQISPFFEEVILRLVAKDREKRFDSAAVLTLVLREADRSTWWRALRRRGPMRRIRIPRETSLRGRDEEMATLRRLFDSVKAGEGQALLIEGEAGIGKTRLVDEFVEQLEGIHYLGASYPPGGAATASGAFSTAYREFFSSGGLTERLSAAPGLEPAFSALLSGEPPPNPLTRAAILRAFALVTESLAAEKPTVVVIEDLQFAPELGRSIFNSLATTLASHRIFLIGTTRPDSPWEIPGLNRMTMRRLTPKELSKLLVELFRSEKLAEELGWAIATKSDGNPFFVFELVRSLREENLIGRAPDGTWLKTGLIKDISVPSSVLDLVEARIRDLEETDKDLLEVASCCGFEFDPLLVANALEIDQIPAMKRFAHLEKEHRLVRSVGRRYVFDHHQVQEALYRGLPELLREPYHAKLGAALEKRGSGDAVDLCEHFLSGAVHDKAVEYLRPALRQLRDGYLIDEAIALADRALAVEGLLEGKERVEILVRQSDALEMRGRHEEDRVVLEEALALAEEKAQRAEIYNHLGRLCIWSGESEKAEEWFIHAGNLAREAGDAKQEAAAAGNLGIVLYRRRRFEECLPLFERAYESARDRHDERVMAVAMLNLGNVFWCRGQLAQAQDRYERYRDLSREIGYREGEALAAGNLGNVFLSLGRLAEAKQHYEEVLAISVETGDRHKIALFEASLARLEGILGHARRARARAQRSLELAREIGMPREEAGALCALAELDGNPPEVLEPALEIYRRIGDGEGMAAALHQLGRYEEALEVARASDEKSLILLSLAALGREEAKAYLPKVSVFERLRAHELLYRVTGDEHHKDRALLIFQDLCAHAPPDAKLAEPCT